MKVKSESKAAQSCLTFSDPVDYSPPGSSVHGIFQARVLEWGAVAFSLVYAETENFSLDKFNSLLGHLTMGKIMNFYNLSVPSV